MTLPRLIGNVMLPLRDVGYNSGCLYAATLALSTVIVELVLNNSPITGLSNTTVETCGSKYFVKVLYRDNSYGLGYVLFSAMCFVVDAN